MPTYPINLYKINKIFQFLQKMPSICKFQKIILTLHCALDYSILSEIKRHRR